MFNEKEPFEMEVREWLRERSIEEALEEADITNEAVLQYLLQAGYIKLPPWLEDYEGL